MEGGEGEEEEDEGGEDEAVVFCLRLLVDVEEEIEAWFWSEPLVEGDEEAGGEPLVDLEEERVAVFSWRPLADGEVAEEEEAELCWLFLVEDRLFSTICLASNRT